MKKNIIKEIVIVLLLILAIILILGVLLYEYVPTNKIVPEKVSYTTPQNVKDELWNDTSETSDGGLNLTYEIQSSDLKNYKKVQEYVPGKKNPFSSIIEQNISEDTNQTSNSNNTTTNSNSNVSKDNVATQNTTGYLPDKGTK